MDAELLFTLCNRAVIPAWLLLAFAPNWKWTQKLIFHAWIPSLLAVCYIYAFVSGQPSPEEGNFTTLAGVLVLFQVPYLALAGWIHYLVFDLFVGAWIVRDGQRHKIHQAFIVPCLFFTLMFGPVGLLMYFVLRFALRKTLTTQEQGQTVANTMSN